MFELQILFANIVLPIVISVVAIGLAVLVWRSSPASEVGTSTENLPLGNSDVQASLASSPATVVITGLAAMASIAVAFQMRNGFEAWPEDSWRRIPHATVIVALAGVLTTFLPAFPRWILRAGALAVASWMVFPVGESWEFLAERKMLWLAAMALAPFVGWVCVGRCSVGQSAALGFGWIMCFATATLLTAQSFLKVTEPMFAVSSVIGCFAIATLRWKLKPSASWLDGAAGPCLFAYAAFIANAQFNSYAGITDWLSFLAMFTPAVAGLLSVVFFPFDAGGLTTADSAQGAKNARRGAAMLLPCATLLLCVATAAPVAVWTYYAAGLGEQSSEEEW